MAAGCEAGTALTSTWELAWGGLQAEAPALTLWLASFPSAMAKFAGPRLPLVMKELVCTHSSVYEIQRVTSTGFLAEVVAACSRLLRAWRAGGTPPTGRPWPPQPEPLPRA